MSADPETPPNPPAAPASENEAAAPSVAPPPTDARPAPPPARAARPTPPPTPLPPVDSGPVALETDEFLVEDNTPPPAPTVETASIASALTALRAGGFAE